MRKIKIEIESSDKSKEKDAQILIEEALEKIRTDLLVTKGITITIKKVK